jgi:cell division septum initiation protein DivIVA
VTDSRINRVKGLLAGPPPGGHSGGPLTGGLGGPPTGAHGGTPIAGGPPPEQAEVPSDAGTPRQALQVLTLAQRTADEHLAKAHHQAEKIHADAQAAAEQVAREAQAHADNVRQDANKMLSDAREAAAQVDREAQARADEAKHNAGTILADAQAQAESIAAEAQANAEALKLQAEQRYQDVVGSLATRREGLQQQIEALERFDREYRARLTSFMQGQLRALWADQPQVNGDVEPPQNGSAAHRDTSAEAKTA